MRIVGRRRILEVVVTHLHLLLILCSPTATSYSFHYPDSRIIASRSTRHLHVRQSIPYIPSLLPSKRKRTSTLYLATLDTRNNEDKYGNRGIDDSLLLVEQPRAGKDGYSLLRQPLLRESWDPSIDPTFDAPKTLQDDDDSKAQQQKNMEWWEQKTQKGKKNQPFLSKQGTSSENRAQEESLAEPTASLEDGLDLFQRSLDTLDLPIVLRALAKECFTRPGRQRVQQAITYYSQDKEGGAQRRTKRESSSAFEPLIASSVEGVQQRYQAVQEMLFLLQNSGDHVNDNGTTGPSPLQGAYYVNRKGYQVTLGQGNPPPLQGLSWNLESILTAVKEENLILEGPELTEISAMMNTLEDLQRWNLGLLRVDDPNIHFEALPNLVSEIHLNTTLQQLLEDALDENGKLSGKTFQVLGQLRAKIRTLRGDILETLEGLVSLPSIQSKLALESGGPMYSEISGRLVLPMNPKYASQTGIVHDSSRSGKTVYVEPSEVVGPTNELRQTEAELKSEEARIWRLLTEQVWMNRFDLQQAVEAVGQVDMVLAKCLLARKLRGVIPLVRDEGVISLQDAKHPVLLLREIQNVVGSDIDLGSDGNQGLILTGPNSGGKTVILKLLGLLALMARGGIPVPALAAREDYQPRVDFFDPVLADIGDIQSVGGDLSTFSGHMLVCREVLVSSGRNSLVLMDELGSGTDPAQGVAIAQALLEALMDTGCRVAITTHYMALKQLAASDERFSVAGMQFVRGRPTYKLLPGTVGESFALAVAERLNLPKSVLERANELLDSETRQMGDLIRELEDQRNLVDEQVAELERKKEELAQLQIKMQEEQNRLEKQLLTARRDEARRFAKALEEKEQILEDVLEKLKADPSRKLIAKSWDDIKFVKRDALNEAENIPSVLRAKQKAAKAAEKVRAELVPLAELREKPEIKEGDTLIVCQQGSLFGREATVVKNMGRQIQVSISGMTMSLKLTDLSAVMDSGVVPTRPKVSAALSKKDRLSKAAEKALQQDKSTRPSPSDDETPKSKSKVAIRTESNTVDVRGSNLEEAKSMVKDKISRCILNGQSFVYVLHGHGTGGVLKTKVRTWLKSEQQLVKRFAPADQADGGDAFTVIEIR